jgi:long-subunit fatty acid transport protein
MSAVYTVYDNVMGGFTVIYKYIDRNTGAYKKNVVKCENERSMKSFVSKLKSSGYKFVGKI